VSTGSRLFVGNLSYELTDDALREAFARVGTVNRAEVVRDKGDGTSRGFGFVEMEHAADGEKALSELSGLELMGRQIRVEVANSPRLGTPRRRASS